MDFEDVESKTERETHPNYQTFDGSTLTTRDPRAVISFRDFQNMRTEILRSLPAPVKAQEEIRSEFFLTLIKYAVIAFLGASALYVIYFGMLCLFNIYQQK